MKNRVALFLYKTLLFILPVLVVFEILFRLGFSPIVTNSTLFDFKMEEVQKRHIRNVKLLSIGSSITLYELNSGVITQNLPISYYNFASWGLQIADMRVLLQDFVKEHHPKYVIICSSLGDFVADRNNSYLNYINTSSLIRNHFPEFFYFKNYSSLYQVIRRKNNAYPVNFDQWGGASLTVKRSKINQDKQRVPDMVFPTGYTNWQYQELASLSSFLEEQHIKLIFIQAPLKPSVIHTAVSKQKLASHFDRCKTIVERHAGIYLNYADKAIFNDSLFVDQYHLQLAGAVILTKLIVKDLKPIIK